MAYLIASVLFIIGLKMLSNPASARAGNLWAAFGMGLAIFSTIFLYNPDAITTYKLSLIFVAILIGTIIGFVVAKKVKMTQMPEMVSLFNGMGGACAALISLIEYPHSAGQTSTIAIIMAGLIIGSISFSGSMVAFAKLNGTLKKSIRVPAYNIINNVLLLAIAAYAVYTTMQGGYELVPLYIIFAAALAYGILFVVPIGGADMPVVISLLNSFTGLAAAFGGFLYGNQVMLTGGILVGSAGTILTLVMCQAMNRPLTNVIFGGFSESGGPAGDSDAQGSIKDTTITDAAVLMNYSKKVIIVPGYGLAVAQAQHVVHELEEALIKKGVEVKYAIHPVAGRMPGHMNVLLAESNVEYDKLAEMEDVNPEFTTTDVVLVVGANDVVNPAAKTDPASPIYGMPILDVVDASHVIVNKRSMNVGYAGIDNALFYNPNTSMLFGDAKKVLSELVSEVNSM
ncbi:MAG: NAD(P)(+) transhydrogenase (Re/Si-specific) subunit beta [Bacteroidia bacterium]|nr:NAD(P)(+) transhydrogenase (Re/Si-specific) subunit beta [Bacteroidia bacterium]